MIYKGSIERGTKRFRRVTRGKRPPTTEKTLAERTYRHTNTQTTRGFRHDPESYDDETFQAPRLTSWDLW